MAARTGSTFSGYRFPDEVITLAGRRYLRYRLGDVEGAEWLAERGVDVDPSTVYDWVQAFTPRFLEAAWDEGRAMRLEQAVAYAITEPDHS